MWYTLAKGLWWFAIAGLVGIVVGWLLRSIVARRQILRARGQHPDIAELERLRGRVANLEPVVAERDRLRDELDACRNAAAGATATSDLPAPGLADTSVSGFASAVPSGRPVRPVADPPAAPDVDGAPAVLGYRVELDDLKVVEGIGPKIEGLCHGIGIRTWFDMSTTEVSLLRTMLNDAGPRFRTHDPSTWPQQAGLLAAGRWAEFKALTDELDGGRPPG